MALQGQHRLDLENFEPSAKRLKPSMYDDDISLDKILNTDKPVDTPDSDSISRPVISEKTSTLSLIQTANEKSVEKSDDSSGEKYGMDAELTVVDKNTIFIANGDGNIEIEPVKCKLSQEVVEDIPEKITGKPEFPVFDAKEPTTANSIETQNEVDGKNKDLSKVVSGESGKIDNESKEETGETKKLSNGEKTNDASHGAETEKNATELQKLKALVTRQQQEITTLRAVNIEWLQDFDSKIEDFRKLQYYRPHSTYDKIVKEQMDRFEQRARKNKVDDIEANRIRKHIQTVCSNHATMYNKLKDYCTENDKLEKQLSMIQNSAKKIGVQKSNLIKSVGTNTVLTEESSNFKKLNLQPSANRRTQTKIRQTKYLVEKPKQKPAAKNIIGTAINNINNVQYVVQQNPNSNGYVMIQNNAVPVQLVNNGNTMKSVQIANSSVQRINQTQSNTSPRPVPATISRNYSSPQPNTPPPANSPALPVPKLTVSPTGNTGQKRARNQGTIDLTDDEPGLKRKNIPTGENEQPNGSIRNSESVQNRNLRQRYKEKSVESGIVQTIIGEIKLPSPPQPPKFEKQGIPQDVKSLPQKLTIEANFEGKNNMKIVWNFCESAKDHLHREGRSIERAACASYELFVCTVRKGDTVDAKRLWQRIGGKDIPGHRIPVKCSLKNFDRENDYIFLVRGKDSLGRVGKFSEYELAKK